MLDGFQFGQYRKFFFCHASSRNVKAKQNNIVVPSSHWKGKKKNYKLRKKDNEISPILYFNPTLDRVVCSD